LAHRTGRRGFAPFDLDPYPWSAGRGRATVRRNAPAPFERCPVRSRAIPTRGPGSRGLCVDRPTVGSTATFHIGGTAGASANRRQDASPSRPRLRPACRTVRPPAPDGASSEDPASACRRCLRPAPPWDSPAMLQWEPIGPKGEFSRRDLPGLSHAARAAGDAPREGARPPALEARAAAVATAEFARGMNRPVASLRRRAYEACLAVLAALDEAAGAASGRAGAAGLT
jgi:hypothetical protein